MKKKHLYLLTAVFSLSAILVGCGNNSDKEYTLEEAQKKTPELIKELKEDYTLLNNKSITVSTYYDDGKLMDEETVAFSIDKEGKLSKLYRHSFYQDEDGEDGQEEGYKYIKSEGITLDSGGKKLSKEEEKDYSYTARAIALAFKKGSEDALEAFNYPTEDQTFVSAVEENGVYVISYLKAPDDEELAFEDEDESAESYLVLNNGEEITYVERKEYSVVKVDKHLNVLGWDDKTVYTGEKGEVVHESIYKTKINDYKWE